MEKPEEVLISWINQFVFCPRRFYLMTVEGVFVDNEHTVTGTALHERADEPAVRSERGKKIMRGLWLENEHLALYGKADVVEFNGNIPAAVEYKKGKRREWDNDNLQLTAQTLCLEEMFSVSIEKGYVYHVSSNKRREVMIDTGKRRRLLETMEAIRATLRLEKPPLPEPGNRCRGCSLEGECFPKLGKLELKMKRLNKSIFDFEQLDG